MRLLGAWLPALLLAGGCGGQPALETVEQVDLARFMGDWYLVAGIVTPLESEAHNPVESYRLLEDGRIATTYTFRDGSFDGPLRRYSPTASIVDRRSNAVWAMQFLWPFAADYQIIYLDRDYSLAVVGRNRRDYLWVMARSPDPPGDGLAAALRAAAEQGYDLAALEYLPQRWASGGGPETGH